MNFLKRISSRKDTWSKGSPDSSGSRSRTASKQEIPDDTKLLDAQLDKPDFIALAQFFLPDQSTENALRLARELKHLLALPEEEEEAKARKAR
jgi:hypothetical protein